ncbi:MULTISPECIES: hypothetical protein [Bacillus cereus group]|uniref:hypothetical protein n=1 Tax=Bacillus cereus group TaxID=86661 RepID=UPI0002385B06|nr:MULTISPECIES: hypothetical protein [unclassified Bacillus cereus group]MCU4952082.1 hypothetical protein [Bacillus paranthracis]BAL20839.1 hypothetical protein BCN_5046 [Bacillus cereus NC7401]MDG1638262.1 hypothetical protein [Bacillus paranthracis]MDX5777641.1 hypothetical protein [Bacillus cereus group sp. DSM 4312]MDX5834056.1 hypothetical protein [Bacillus cereus group sp. BfR-BA-01748]
MRRKKRIKKESQSKLIIEVNGSEAAGEDLRSREVQRNDTARRPLEIIHFPQRLPRIRHSSPSEIIDFIFELGA